MNHSDGGKGSKPRPFSVTQDEYDKRWEAIFGRDEPEEEQDDDNEQEDDDADTTEE